MDLDIVGSKTVGSRDIICDVMTCDEKKSNMIHFNNLWISIAEHIQILTEVG